VTAPAGREGVPDLVAYTVEHGVAVYRWPVLPRHPGLLVFFAVLAAIVCLPGPLLLLAEVLDRLETAQAYVHGARGVWLVGLILCAFTLKAGPFFVVALFGRCRLTVSPDVFDYEVTVFGRRLRAESRHLGAREVVTLAIRDPKHGLEATREGGRRFKVKLPIGAGALSVPEAQRLRDRWLADMARSGSRVA
jgi:hypothetical protein